MTAESREPIKPRSLVTGAGRRLGREMALFLAKRGHDVAVHYASSPAEAESVAEIIRSGGGRAAALQADLTDEAQMQTLVGRASDALGGPLTCLVNNASIFEHDTLSSATRASWDRHVECNLRAPFVLTQAMAAQGLAPRHDPDGQPVAAGLIVNIIDQRVHAPSPEFMTYTIAKMALWAMTRTTAQALAPSIRVNAIGPGPTLRGARQSAEQFAAQRKATILGRGANPQEIAAALAYFLDAPAVTGQMLCIDGGQHLNWRIEGRQGLE